MNGPLDSILANLQEEAGWRRNDLDALARVAWYLEEMRGNDVPRDLYVNIRGGASWQRPWAIHVYADMDAVESNHLNPLDGQRPAVVEGVERFHITLAPIRDPWTSEAA